VVAGAGSGAYGVASSSLGGPAAMSASLGRANDSGGLAEGKAVVAAASVLTALADALSDDDIAHAAIEVESLVWAHPALTDKQWARHVRSACSLYREAGHPLLLIAQTLETDGDAAEFPRCRR
jgi:hypothetical protein